MAKATSRKSQVAQAVAATAAPKTSTFQYDGHKFAIDGQTDAIVRDAMQAQRGMADRYLKVEPLVSNIFGAPLCYQSGTIEAKALRAFFESRAVTYDAAQKLRAEQEEAKKAGDPTKAHALSLQAVVEEKRVETDASNAVRACKQYHTEGRKGERKEREVKGPRQLLKECRDKLVKIAKSDDWPAADLKIAREAIQAINAIIPEVIELDLKKVAGQRDKRAEQAGPVRDVTKEYEGAKVAA